jgi:hypothetical protein
MATSFLRAVFQASIGLACGNAVQPQAGPQCVDFFRAVASMFLWYRK